MVLKTSWTPEEDDFLGLHYTKSPTEEIALALNRTVIAVRNRAQIIGLNKRLNRYKEDGTILCCDCKEFKTPENFYFPKGKPYSKCTICCSKRAKKLHFEKKQKALDTEKENFIKSYGDEPITCTLCKEPKTIREFHIYRRNKYNKVVRHPHCIPCHNLKNKELKLNKERNNEYATQRSKTK